MWPAACRTHCLSALVQTQRAGRLGCSVACAMLCAFSETCSNCRKQVQNTRLSVWHSSMPGEQMLWTSVPTYLNGHSSMLSVMHSHASTLCPAYDAGSHNRHRAMQHEQRSCTFCAQILLRNAAVSVLKLSAWSSLWVSGNRT